MGNKELYVRRLKRWKTVQAKRWAGWTYARIGELIGASVQSAYQMFHAAQPVLFRPRRPRKGGGRLEKWQTVQAKRKAGWTYVRIGELIGVTKQRAQQIYTQPKPEGEVKDA